MRTCSRFIALFVVIFALIFKSECSYAINQEAKFNRLRISPVEILPSSEVNDVYQDNLGFTYFATLDGLYRYDGVNIKSYLSDPNSTNCLSTNMILNIVADKNGYIWLGTYGRGVSRLDPRTDSITNFKISKLSGSGRENDNIEAMCIDNDNCLWVGNRMGIHKLELDSNSNIINIENVRDESNDQSLNSVIKKIFQAQNGDILLGYSDTLHQITTTKDGKKHINKIPISSIQAIYEDEKGLYIAGAEISFIPYNKASKTYADKPQKIFNRKGTSITKFKDKLIVGSRQGVFCLEQSGNKWQIDYHIDRDNAPFELKSDVVSSVYNTNDTHIWVTTRGGGAYTISQKNKIFKNISLINLEKNIELTRVVFEDSQNNLWVGTEQDGLIYCGNQTKPLSESYKIIEIGTTYENRVYSVEETENNGKRVIWVGTTSPTCLVKIDAQTKRTIPHKNNICAQLGNIFALRKSDNNTLWAGTYDNGLWRIKLDNNGEVIDAEQFSTINSNISSNIVRNISIDSKGEMWIGTDMGINRIAAKEIDSKMIHFEHHLDNAGKFSTSDHYILQITESSTGDMLLSTMGSGFIIYNPKTDSVKQITTKDNLANNSVKTIVEDKSTGKLWISTNFGLSSFDPKTDSLTNYQDTGLLSTLEFSEYCGLMSYSGNIIFGNNIGVTLFMPEEIHRQTNTPKPFLREVFINEKQTKPNRTYNGDKVLTLSPEYTDSVSVCYDNRNISFAFVGIDYVSPEQVLYSHKLEGYDLEWSEPSSYRRRATYTNLQEGDYTLKVRTANADGVWSDETLEVKVHIDPPFYRTVWAYIFYNLLIALFIAAIFYVQRTLYRKRLEVTRLNYEKHYNEEVTQTRLQFFTNISHEFRTPLTLIDISLESIEERAFARVAEDDIEDAKIIHRNSNILKNLIDEQLEFRRIENGKAVYKPRQMEVNRFMELFHTHFSSLAKKRHIQFTYTPYSESLVANIDNRQLQKVMFNLISNAFKHTPENSSISLSIELEGSKIVVRVSDKGDGISPEDLPYIFDRFYQAKNENSTHEEGSGIGLALCKKIMELHGGDIVLESELGKGTTSIVTLDLLSDSMAIESDMEYCIDKKYAARYKWVDDVAKPSITKQDIESKTVTLLESIEDAEFSENQDDTTIMPKILIVEDNVTLLDKLKKVLEHRYTVFTAQNGVEGLEVARNKWPDIILLDLMMPKMNGIEMSQILKSTEETSHIPVIMMTADGSEENQLNCYKVAKVDAYIEKPFNVKVLLNQISTILSNRQLTIERFNKNVIVNVEELSDSAADKKFLQEILAIIKRNMDNSELTIEHIANEYGVSRVYLNRKIKALTNLTSNQFLRDVRLKKAARLLKGNNELNINEVAWQVGYTDIRTFRTRFKEMFGVTPSVYSGRSEK